MIALNRLFTAFFIISYCSAMAQYQPDILGSGFEQQTMDQGSDYSGEVVATLVRATPLEGCDRAILYIHGYNDYFFQREMAERFVDAGYNFYAVDLRRYGRSLRAGQTPFEVREVEEYFPDIDAALEIMREEGVRSVTLMGHSTGGLITSLYCDARRSNGMIDGLILNSPFFDMNLSWALETLAMPVVSIVGRYKPDLIVSKDSSPAYFQSLLSDFHGEWSYNTEWKMSDAEPISAGWLRAIYRAQTKLQGGLDISIPVLVMYSDKSFVTIDWSEECQTSDIVLDVKDIAQHSDALGNNISKVEIKDGMHDLILSGFEARESCYRTIFEWLQQR